MVYGVRMDMCPLTPRQDEVEGVMMGRQRSLRDCAIKAKTDGEYELLVVCETDVRPRVVVVVRDRDRPNRMRKLVFPR